MPRRSSISRKCDSPVRRVVRGAGRGRADYNEWGEITYREALDITSSYRRIWPQSSYTGHDWDDVLGMYYAKARFYSAEDKRFVSMDPIKGEIVNPLSLVPYVYCVNNPLRWVDPLGLMVGRAGMVQTMVSDGGGGGKAVSPKDGKKQAAKNQLKVVRKTNVTQKAEFEKSTQPKSVTKIVKAQVSVQIPSKEPTKAQPTKDVAGKIKQDIRRSDVKKMMAIPVPIFPPIPIFPAPSIGPRNNTPSVFPWQRVDNYSVVPQRENGWDLIGRKVGELLEGIALELFEWTFLREYKVKKTVSDFMALFGCHEGNETTSESGVPADTEAPVDVAGTPSNSPEDDKDKGPEQEKEPTPPDVKYPGDQAATPPGPDYEWRGQQPVGGDKGAWYNPKTGESWHPDLNHPSPIGPHWDYTPYKGGPSWRIYSDGRVVLGN